MRTTLKIDQDVLDKARQLAGRLHVPLRSVVNSALRAGLNEVEKPAVSRPYNTTPHDMGIKRGFSLDNIQDLLAQAEGENAR
jgi:hypothetical protein